MTGVQVDSFSARLKAQLESLDWQTRNELFVKIGREELKMRSNGVERPTWHGPLPEDQILGATVVIPTEQGERRGRVICFGVVNSGGSDSWERSVIVCSDSSGTVHEGPGSAARLATPEDSERIQSEMAMARKLAEAADAAQRGAVAPSQERPRKRGQRDPNLVGELNKLAVASPNVKAVEEGASNFKIVGTDTSRRIYLFKNQLRADLSGFTVDHPGVRKISDEEARDMHLGKVRGQLTFDDRTTSLAAFTAALAALGG